MIPSVMISLVTYNSSRYLRLCLESLRAQTGRGFTAALWDNASTDDSLLVARQFEDVLGSIHASDLNIGFCAAHNRLMASTDTEFILVLNPDVVLEPSFLAILVQALASDPGAGAATGKLWRWQMDATRKDPAPPRAPGTILDTTGIYVTPNQRHLDRGSDEPDRGQYDRRQYVFGASGAAALYRRAMLEDVRYGSEYFDENFFAYREDADLAWRSQWLGWRCLYVPEATGFHVRRVLPQRRSALPSAINMHSFKNRFLLRVKNMDAGTYARFLLPVTVRDFMAFGYVLLREPSSLQALPLLFRTLPKAWAQRRSLCRRRRVSPRDMRGWFSNHPVARNLPAHPIRMKD